MLHHTRTLLSFDNKESQNFWNIPCLDVDIGEIVYDYLSQICPTNITVQHRKGQGWEKSTQVYVAPTEAKELC